MSFAPKPDLLKIATPQGLIPYPDKRDLDLSVKYDFRFPPVDGDSTKPKNYMVDNDMVQAVFEAETRRCTNHDDWETVPMESMRASIDPDKMIAVFTIKSSNTTKHTARMTCRIASPSGTILFEDSCRFDEEGYVYERKVMENKKADDAYKACCKSEKHAAVLTQGGKDFIIQKCSQVPAGTTVCFSFTMKLPPQSWQPCVATRNGTFQDVALFIPFPSLASCGASAPEVSVHVASPTDGKKIELPDEPVASQGLHDSEVEEGMRIWLPADEDGSASVTLPNGPCGNTTVLFRLVKWDEEGWEKVDELNVSSLNLDDTLSVTTRLSLALKEGRERASLLDVRLPSIVAGIRPVPVHLLFILDMSGSMCMKVEGNPLDNREMAKGVLDTVVRLLVSPTLLKNASFADVKLTIACFHHKTTVLGTADLKDVHGVLSLLKACHDFKETGGTSFTSWLDVLCKTLNASHRPLIVVLSDGGDCDPDGCLQKVKQISEVTGAEWMTRGIGEYINEKLMIDIATIDCKLYPCIDKAYETDLCKSVVAALLYVSRKVDLCVCEPHVLLSVQGVDGTPAPPVDVRMSDVDEVEGVVYVRPGGKYSLYVHGPEGAPVYVRMGTSDPVDASAPRSSGTKADAYSFLAGIDSMHQQTPTSFTGADRSPITSDIGVRHQIVTEHTKAFTKVIDLHNRILEQIFRPDEDENLLRFSSPLRNAPNRLPFSSSPPFFCQGGLGSVSCYRGLSPDSDDEYTPVYRSCSFAPSSRPTPVGKPGVASWLVRPDPWQSVRHDVAGALAKIEEIYGISSTTKRVDIPEWDEADKLVKMAALSEAESNTPLPFKKDVPSPQKQNRLLASLFLRRISLEYNLGHSDFDAASNIGAIAGEFRKEIVAINGAR